MTVKTVRRTTLVLAAVLAFLGWILIGPDLIDTNPAREGDGRAKASS